MVQVSDAKHTYISEFESFAANGACAAPGWLKDLRSAAIARFAELGFPSMRIEEWRFTSVKAIAETPFSLKSTPARTEVSVGDIEHLLIGGLDRSRLVFVNGRYSEELSLLDGLTSDVTLTSLASQLDHDSELVRKHLGRYASYQDNAFTALSTAFIRDGAFVYVAPDTVLEQPIQVLYLTVPRGEPGMAHPRSLVVIDANSRARFIEMYASLEGGVYLTNTVTEIVLREGAQGECYRIQRESEEGYHTAATHMYLGKDCRFSLATFAMGAALSRHDINLVLDGTGTEGTLNGLYVIGGRQHVDHHTTIEHAKPDCTSHEHFNGVLDDRARAVFNGRIIVRPGAQRTDSKQTNNNLLLSETARADSQPQLEIYADDVRCTHGATLGPLDKNAQFYIQSRGIDDAEARRLMTYGFAADILDRVESDVVREYLDRAVKARLAN